MDPQNSGMDYDESLFAQYLNDIYGDVEICGTEYPAGDALFAVDPTAFRVGQADWESQKEEDE